MAEDYENILRSLRNNRTSGATELALRTLMAFKDYLQSIPEQSADTIESRVAELSAARPSMLPLANALRRWLKKLEDDDPYDKAHYLEMLEAIYQQLSSVNDRVAENAVELFKPGITVMTHSRSSQVLALFEHAWEQYRDFKVIVTLSAPGNEGLLVASQLSNMGVPVTVITDAEMGLVMPDVDLNISGCDSWLTDHHFVNKTGTLLQALAAHHFGKPFWVLADSFKNNQQTSQQVTLESMPGDELKIPKGENIAARNTYFETISTRLVSGRVDEYGLQALQG
jgi:translation initiation factor 2B subunit (eIF-2B alpha/beta/delta family)